MLSLTVSINFDNRIIVKINKLINYIWESIDQLYLRINWSHKWSYGFHHRKSDPIQKSNLSLSSWLLPTRDSPYLSSPLHLILTLHHPTLNTLPLSSLIPITPIISPFCLFLIYYPTQISPDNSLSPLLSQLSESLYPFLSVPTTLSPTLVHSIRPLNISVPSPLWHNPPL
jgi:hypothetical protein